MKALKKQGVAWVIAALMIVAAIGIGKAKAPPAVDVPGSVGPGSSPVEVESFYVYDDAGVLSAKTEEKITCINLELYKKLDVLIAVVTTNYGREDLYDFALNYAGNIGLGGNDFIVVLDISGENYWLVQGSDLMYRFTDEDCGDYAWNYMESDFARGDYDGAVLALTEALETWYYENF